MPDKMLGVLDSSRKACLTMRHMSQVSQATPRISYLDAVKEFESPAAMARDLGVSRASVSEWKDKGELPEGRVWQLIAMFPSKFGHLQPTAAEVRAA